MKQFLGLTNWQTNNDNINKNPTQTPYLACFSSCDKDGYKNVRGTHLCKRSRIKEKQEARCWLPRDAGGKGMGRNEWSWVSSKTGMTLLWVLLLELGRCYQSIHFPHYIVRVKWRNTKWNVISKKMSLAVVGSEISPGSCFKLPAPSFCCYFNGCGDGDGGVWLLEAGE